MSMFWNTANLTRRMRGTRFLAWLRGERGSLNVIYALALIPMLGALGLATDTARGFLLKARLSQAIDQAVLAGGKVISRRTAIEDVLKYFSANFPNSASITFGSEFEADFMDARVTLDEPVEGGIAGSETAALDGERHHPHHLHAGAERRRLHELQRDDRGGAIRGRAHDPRAGRGDLARYVGIDGRREPHRCCETELAVLPGRRLRREQQPVTGAGRRRYRRTT